MSFVPPSKHWASTKTKVEAATLLNAAGLMSGPCFTDEEIVHDEHVARRHMLVELPRTDGVEQPVLIPGNPIKFAASAKAPRHGCRGWASTPMVVLQKELGLSMDELASCFVARGHRLGQWLSSRAESPPRWTGSRCWSSFRPLERHAA